MSISFKKIALFLSTLIFLFLEPYARFSFDAEINSNCLSNSYKNMSVLSNGDSLKTLDLKSEYSIDNVSVFNVDYYSKSDIFNAHISILLLAKLFNSANTNFSLIRVSEGRAMEAWISWNFTQSILKAGVVPEYFANLQIAQNKSPTINHIFGTGFGEVYDGSGSWGISFKKLLNKNLDLYTAAYYKMFNEPGNTAYEYMGNQDPYDKKNIIINLGSNYNKNSFQFNTSTIWSLKKVDIANYLYSPNTHFTGMDSLWINEKYMNIFGISIGFEKKFKNLSISNENTIGFNLTDGGYNNLFGKTNYYNQGQSKWVYYLKKTNGTDSTFATDFINVYSVSSWMNIDFNFKHIVSHNFFGFSKGFIINDTYKNKEVIYQSMFSRNVFKWMLGASASVNIFKWMSIEPEFVYYYYEDLGFSQPLWFETFGGEPSTLNVYFKKYEIITGISLNIRI